MAIGGTLKKIFQIFLPTSVHDIVIIGDGSKQKRESYLYIYTYMISFHVRFNINLDSRLSNKKINKVVQSDIYKNKTEKEYFSRKTSFQVPNTHQSARASQSEFTFEKNVFIKLLQRFV